MNIQMDCQSLNLFALPDDVLQNILAFFTYHEICLLRETSSKFNSLGKRILKHAFRQYEEQIRNYRKELRQLLPRRESERNKHPFFRHSEVLSAIETRVSLLDMGIMRYAEDGFCAFFPGKVLDELKHVLFTLRASESIPKPHEFLHELRDMSSMAIEYFDEVLLPRVNAARDNTDKINRGSFLGPGLSNSSLDRPCTGHYASTSNTVHNSFWKLFNGGPGTDNSTSNFNQLAFDNSLEFLKCSQHNCFSSELNSDSIVKNDSNLPEVDSLRRQIIAMRGCILQIGLGLRTVMRQNAQLSAILATQAQKMKCMESREFNLNGDMADPIGNDLQLLRPGQRRRFQDGKIEHEQGPAKFRHVIPTDNDAPNS